MTKSPSVKLNNQNYWQENPLVYLNSVHIYNYLSSEDDTGFYYRLRLKLRNPGFLHPVH